jgi:hypothetical protein
MAELPSGGAYILEMFQNTKDSTLTFPPHYIESGPFTLRWEQDDAMRTAIECDRLLTHLRLIGEVFDELKPTRQENERILSPTLLEVWDIYVRPLDVGKLDRARASGIQTLKDLGRPIPREDWIYLQKFRQAELFSAMKRLPYGGIEPSELIRRGYRYTKLVSLDAPAIIMRNEARLFARAYALYLWAED